jgi:hypothetical protein
MKRNLVAFTIITLTCLIAFAAIGCGKPTSKMSASAVCQYVNQSLKTEYTRIPGKTVNPYSYRYRVEYRAKSAVFEAEKGSADRWLVNVESTLTPEELAEGQWRLWGRASTQKVTSEYYYYESTGAVIKK